MKIVNFRVSDAEHAAMKAVCAHEFLNVSTYIRRHFNMRAAELGLKIPDPVVLPPTTATDDLDFGDDGSLT